MTKIESFKDLIVYKKAYKLAMRIFEISRGFPKEETYSLSDQIRRSSRSVTSCISEAWAKRRYEKHFVSKLTDSLGEEHETETWIDYSRDCKYINIEVYEELTQCCDEVRRILISMINNPDKWCPN
jgi:four helix bundle protein